MEKNESILSTIEIDIKKVAWHSLWMTILFSILGLVLYGFIYREYEINIERKAIYVYNIFGDFHE